MSQFRVCNDTDGGLLVYTVFARTLFLLSSQTLIFLLLCRQRIGSES